MRTMRNRALVALVVLAASGMGAVAAQDAGIPQKTGRFTIAPEVLSAHGPAVTGPLVQELVRRTGRRWLDLLPAEVKGPGWKQGNAIIEFVLHADGRVTNMMLARPSGSVAMDRAAWEAIARSAPYEAFPKEVGLPEVRLQLTFNYNEPETAEFHPAPVFR